MWFISKYVDEKNKKTWSAQSGINQTILEMQSKINQRLELHFDEAKKINQRIDHYYDGIKELHQIIRKLELKLTKGKK